MGLTVLAVQVPILSHMDPPVSMALAVAAAAELAVKINPRMGSRVPQTPAVVAAAVAATHTLGHHQTVEVAVMAALVAPASLF